MKVVKASPDVEQASTSATSTSQNNNGSSSIGNGGGGSGSSVQQSGRIGDVEGSSSSSSSGGDGAWLLQQWLRLQKKSIATATPMSDHRVISIRIGPLSLP